MSQRAIDLRTTLTRRRLLTGLGGLTVALTSPIWRSATVFGQDANQKAAKRFIGVFSANGTVAKDFFPAGTAPDQPLTLGRILAPLEAHREKLLVLKGVHMRSTIENELGKAGALKPGGPHMKGPGAMLTGGSLNAGSFTGSGGPAGWADRISLDQLLANRIGAQSRFKSLEFGVRIGGQEPLRVISYRGSDAPNLPVDDPFQMYKRIFENADLSNEELERLMAERRSVLDFLKDDLGRMEKRVTSDDKARIEAHLDSVRNVEQSLQGMVSSCQPLALPTKFDPKSSDLFPTTAKLQMDLMLLAHRCNMTRVSTFMFANADSWQHFPWVGIDEEHHELSHAGDADTAAQEKLVKINTWHSEQVKYMLDALAAAREPDGSTLLDGTCLLWGNELGAGNTHTYKDIPWLMAGGAGGYFKTGRYLKYQDQPHNNLLVSVCNAMGLSDVTSFGIAGVCTGPLQGLQA